MFDCSYLAWLSSAWVWKCWLWGLPGIDPASLGPANWRFPDSVLVKISCRAHSRSRTIGIALELVLSLKTYFVCEQVGPSTGSYLVYIGF